MKRYKHNLSHYHNTTFDMGELIPAQVIEVMPGDTIKGSTSALIRLAALVRPVMFVPFHVISLKTVTNRNVPCPLYTFMQSNSTTTSFKP